MTAAAARRGRGCVVVDVAGWCVERLGCDVEAVTFETGHLSRVLGLRLRDGREVVVKVRPWQERLVTCVAVQEVLAGLGFPCPRPLAGPDRIGQPVQAVHAEQLLPGGQMMPPGGDAAGMFAALLADLVALTPYVAATQLASLRACSPPWVGWDHTGEQLWPARDTPGSALHEQPGPDWVDEVTAAAQTLLLSASDLPLVLGHGDWESQNLRWIDRRPRAVHDWDSLVAQPEPAVVGAAAAVWPAGAEGRHAATVQESEAFLDAYQHAAGRTWNDSDQRLAWASGLWLRTYNAKKDAADGGGPQLDLLANEVDQRRRLAGL